MKITLNADVKPDVIETMLKKQKDKMDKINKFCNDNKIETLSYKDSELEYEYKQDIQKPKVETRPKQQNKEVRKGE